MNLQALIFTSILSLQSLLVLAKDDPQVITDIKEYNAIQEKRALEFPITERQTVGSDSCVCHSVNNIKNALEQKKVKLTIDEEKNCIGSFHFNYLKFTKLHKGTMFGGIGAFNDLKFTNTEKALNAIISELDAGKIAAISLNARPLYDSYLENNQNVVHEELPKWINHAVVVIGLNRDQDGSVNSFYIADSSGPSRKYKVSYDALYKGYDSLRFRASRGVYIPLQRIHSKIAYYPISK